VSAAHRFTQVSLTRSEWSLNVCLSVCLSVSICVCIFIPPHGNMVGILSPLCLFVRLRISQRRKKIAALNFADLFDYYRSRSSPILVKFGLRGVMAAPTRGDFGGLHALDRLAGQWAVGITDIIWWDMHLASKCTCMAALWNGAGHYIFILWFLLSSFFFLLFFFFHRLILAVGDWMSTILPRMVWP